MENQTKCWWSLQAISRTPISQYTYGPGYYTAASLGTCFASEAWAFELLYRKMTMDFYLESREDYLSYHPEEEKNMTFEESERYFLRSFEKYKGATFLKNSQTRETENFEDRFKIEGNKLTIRLTGTISITIECLESDDTKNEARAQKILKKFIEKCTN